MTAEQYDRWKDFALRMARACFPQTAPEGHPTAEWIADQVECFIADFADGTFEDIVDWDSEPYICDQMSEWETETLWYYFRGYATDDDLHWYEIHEELDDGYDNPIQEEVVERFSAPVRCCVRAGLDFASAPSAGVLGFTVGDVRRMYPEGVPEWITGGDEKWCPWLRDHDESECHKFDEFPDSMGVVL